MIELAHGAIRRGRVRVLHPAGLELPAAGNVGIVGVNGAGKSTLFSALAQLLEPRAGTATLGTYTRAPCMACAPQQPTFPSWLSVEQVARLYGFTFAQLEEAAAGMLLDELRARRAAELSVGQRQTLSVALALALDAPLTMLDEPFAPLDFRRRIALVRLLRQRGERTGRLTLISSQAAVDLLDTCGWIVVLRDGRYVHSGAAAELAGNGEDLAGARQRFEDAIMSLLGAAAPDVTQG